LLSYVGIAPERLRLDWVSSSEAGHFADIVGEFTRQIRALGPLETKEVD